MDKELEAAIEKYSVVNQMIKDLYQEKDKLLALIYTHMEVNGAKRLETETHSVVIPTKRSYDPQKFVAVFGESMSPSKLQQYVTPEHEEVKVVPARVNGQKVKKMWDMGDEVVAKLQKTLIPPKPEIKVTTKKKKEQAL